MKEIEFRTLHAVEIEVRDGRYNKDKTKKSLLLYKDARCDMDRLDEQFGRYGWQRDHKDIHGVSYCGVGLWDDEFKCWVWKWDAGEKSQASPEKGEASDAFKRACVNWGIGRELYSAPQIWVDASVNTYDIRVDHIEYNDDREIVALKLVNKQGAVVFQMGASKPAPAAPVQTKGGAIYPAKEPKPETQEETLSPEQKQFKELTKQIQDATTWESLKAIMATAKSSPYREALRQVGNNKARANNWHD